MSFLPCAAHNIQLVLKDALNLNAKYTALINRITHDIVSKSKFSILIAEELQAFNKKFVKRIITRWNSILFMVRSVLKVTPSEFEKIRKAMPILNKKQKEAKKKFFLSEEDRDMLNELKTVLEWFEWATDEFQTNSVSISRVFPCVRSLIEKLAKVDYSAIHTQQIRSDLLGSLMKRFGDLVKNEVFVVSTFLDPNFGLRAFPNDEKANVRARVKALINAVLHIVEKQADSSVRFNPKPAPSRETNYVFYENEVTEDDDDLRLTQEDSADKIINDYIRNIRDSKNICPLKFWLKHELTYPALATLARKYLSVQASSAAVERMFSISGHIFSDKRRRLGKQLFSNLVILKLNENYID